MAESQVATQETPPMSREDLETLAKNETNDDGLILGKFKSVEDLAASYKELEGKLGQKEEPAEEETEAKAEEKQSEESEFDANEFYGEGLAETLKEVGIDPQEISQRFQENNEITEDDYAKLAEGGLSKNIVDTYLNGLRGGAVQTEEVATQQIQEIKTSVGGEQNYERMAEWASNNLTESEFNSFNKLTETADAATIKFAVQGLYSQYQNAMGVEPELVTGRASTAGPTPYRSTAEVVTAMKDPRYGKDVTYTENVQRKLADSEVFTTRS